MKTLCKRLVPIVMLSLLILIVPAEAQAKNLHFADSPTVTRGDFLRSAIKTLNISVVGGQDLELPYKRVPGSMLPYVRAAHKADALGSFGTNLYLGQTITRGEAARVMVELLDSRSHQKANPFRDVRRGTMEEKAVRVVIENVWMEPLRENYFGLSRKITGRQANSLILRAAGQEDGAEEIYEPPTSTVEGPDTIQIRFDTRVNEKDLVLPNAQLIDAVWRLLNQDFLYKERIDETEASYRAIESIVESLEDPYSSFMRPIKAKNFQTQLMGEVSGIGAQVEERDGIVTVVTPLTGSPAEKAGLKPNDQIIKVDGKSIKGMDFIEAVELIRGKRGSTVVLTINRSGIVFDVSVVRDTVRVPEIDISWQGDIAVVKLMQFGKLTDTELRGEMEDIQEQNPKGIILDVRNNPGGLLHAANIVLSNFVPAGSDVAQIKSRKNTRTDTTLLKPTINSNVRVVVLVNGGSASASEIVAGALQDHERATIVGEKTFGKGTVQQVLQFSNDSSLKMTVAEWLTPDGRKINDTGVTPDIEVPYENERDAQLIKALDILR